MDNEKVPENPPAFPRPGFEQPAGMQDGMTLRDWFAGQALPELINAMMSGRIGNHPKVGGGPEGFAASAYEIADAMLAARKEDSHAG